MTRRFDQVFPAFCTRHTRAMTPDPLVWRESYEKKLQLLLPHMSAQLRQLVASHPHRLADHRPEVQETLPQGRRRRTHASPEALVVMTLVMMVTDQAVQAPAPTIRAAMHAVADRRIGGGTKRNAAGLTFLPSRSPSTSNSGSMI